MSSARKVQLYLYEKLNCSLIAYKCGIDHDLNKLFNLCPGKTLVLDVKQKCSSKLSDLLFTS